MRKTELIKKLIVTEQWHQAAAKKLLGLQSAMQVLDKQKKKIKRQVFQLQ